MAILPARFQAMGCQQGKALVVRPNVFQFREAIRHAKSLSKEATSVNLREGINQEGPTLHVHIRRSPRTLLAIREHLHAPLSLISINPPEIATIPMPARTNLPGAGHEEHQQDLNLDAMLLKHQVQGMDGMRADPGEDTGITRICQSALETAALSVALRLYSAAAINYLKG